MFNKLFGASDNNTRLKRRVTRLERIIDAMLCEASKNDESKDNRPVRVADALAYEGLKDTEGLQQ